jgi:DNA-directed RNA polymerase subunit RPC12/RpoP
MQQNECTTTCRQCQFRSEADIRMKMIKQVPARDPNQNYGFYRIYECPYCHGQAKIWYCGE